MKDDNLEVNEEKNWIKVKVDSTVFKPPHIVTAANEFTENSWIVMNTDSEGNTVVKILPKENYNKDELKELGLDFQTNLVAKSVEMMKSSSRKK